MHGETSREAVGEVIQTARLEAGLSLERAAESWGVAPNTLRRLENGKTVRPASFEAVVEGAKLDDGIRRTLREVAREQGRICARIELVAGFDDDYWTSTVEPILRTLRTQQDNARDAGHAPATN